MKRGSKIIFIVGPTAAGKSQIAIELAKGINAEIICCDSMQVYKEISITSAKPSPKELKEVPHHLFSAVSVKDEFDVMQFSSLALEALSRVQGKAKVPIFVGGSGHYMAVLLYGLFPGGEPSQAFRNEMNELAKTHGPDFLHQKLKEVDLPAADKIHPHDQKRVIRALEVYHQEGRPISQLQKERSGLWGKHDINIFVINRERSDLYERIDKRVEDMFTLGAVEEIRKIKRSDWSKTASQLIGVKEVLALIDGEIGTEEAKELIKRNTRRLAKRQLTWFRQQEKAHWIDINERTKLDLLSQNLQKECCA